jgi:hypothetical protein
MGSAWLSFLFRIKDINQPKYMYCTFKKPHSINTLPEAFIIHISL